MRIPMVDYYQLVRWKERKLELDWGSYLDLWKEKLKEHEMAWSLDWMKVVYLDWMWVKWMVKTLDWMKVRGLERPRVRLTVMVWLVIW